MLLDASRQGNSLISDATNQGVSEITKQLSAYRELMAPYINGGNDAMTQKRALLGLGTGSGNPLDESNPAFWQAYQDNVNQFLRNGGDLNDPNAEKYLRADTQRSLAAGTASGSYAVNTPESQQAAAMKTFENSPYFQAITKQSEDAILQNASATGGLRGGNTQDALAKTRPILLQSLIDKQIANLTGLTSSGQGAATALGGAGQAAGAQIANTQLTGATTQASNLMTGAGGFANAEQQAAAAQAGGALAQSNANIDMLGNVAGTLGNKFAGGLNFGGTPAASAPATNTGFGTGNAFGNQDLGSFL